MSRFRWTRAKYRRAHHLNRLLSKLDYYGSQKPALVERFHELWERHPQGSDPLLAPIHWRYDRDDIPF